MLPNTPEAFEAAHGVPMTGGVLNMLNTRLDAEAIAFMLDHGEARVLLTDTEFAPTMKAALELTRRELIVIDVDDSRSEEHTSELQSLMRISYADFCVKKKKQNNSD